MPPGVAIMLPQHFMTSLPPAAYYPSAAAAMYSAYGNAGGLDDLAAMQRNAGLHTLVGASNNPTVPQPGGLKAVNEPPEVQLSSLSIDSRASLYHNTR